MAIGLYALMWLGYAENWAWLARVDAWVLEPMDRVGAAHPGWVTAWNFFCTVLGPNAFRLVVLVVIVVALVRRHVRIAMFLFITVELSGVVNEIAKVLVDRPRPATAMVWAYGTSFPSGHAMGAMVAVLALLTVVLPVVRASRRGWLIAIGIGLVVGIGVGRVALNVHHPSDVIAGWALGYAYFVACVLMLPPRGRPPRSRIAQREAQDPITHRDETPAVPDSAR
ncbi:phosphatase PAP2 family protein [Mycolicibacterium cyprinidarum]|nr:phosphatase PAP2 family protein [Mycolicibacterium sp. NGTWS1803]